MKGIYHFVFHTAEYKGDSFNAYWEFFISQGHLLHVFLISLGIALLSAIIFYLVFGQRLWRKLSSPTAWWVTLAITGCLTFFGTGNSCGLTSNKHHSLNQVLDKKMDIQVSKEGVLDKTQCSQYNRYSNMKDNFGKGMFKVKPVLAMATTNAVISILTFWLLSIMARMIISTGNTAKGSPRFLRLINDKNK